MNIETRLAIIMAGGGAAGKTTATKEFGIGKPEEFRVMENIEFRDGWRESKVLYTLFDNCGLSGNYNSGTDSNTGPNVVKSAFWKSMALRNITIVDGMCSSPRWVTMCNDYDLEFPDHELEILLIWFDIGPEDLMDRLESRRGVSKETFRERMFPRCKTLTRRAELLKEHCENLSEIPYEIIPIGVNHSPDDIVDEMDNFVCDYYGTETMQELVEAFGYGS